MWRWFLAFAALPSAMVAVAYRLLPESPRFLQVMGRHDEAMQVGVVRWCCCGIHAFWVGRPGQGRAGQNRAGQGRQGKGRHGGRGRCALATGDGREEAFTLRKEGMRMTSVSLPGWLDAYRSVAAPFPLLPFPVCCCSGLDLLQETRKVDTCSHEPDEGNLGGTNRLILKERTKGMNPLL